MPQVTPANLEKAFAILCECAVRGERCPVASGPNAHPFLKSAHTSALAREGKIRIEVYAHNWRVVTILTGSHKGKHTQLNPYKSSKPYHVVDINGLRTNGRLIDRSAAKRQKPWSPPRFGGEA